MDEIIIDSIKFKGRHGCSAIERGTLGDFEVSMKLRLPLNLAAKTDTLDDTIDYPAAIAVAEGVISGESARLIETLADRIAERLFTRFANLRSAEIEVVKIGVNVGFDFKKIAVRIERDRQFYFPSK